ncbi:hypothetical protein KC19_11G167200, partial [Ceratodon purpureus]
PGGVTATRPGPRYSGAVIAGSTPGERSVRNDGAGRGRGRGRGCGGEASLGREGKGREGKGLAFIEAAQGAVVLRQLVVAGLCEFRPPSPQQLGRGAPARPGEGEGEGEGRGGEGGSTSQHSIAQHGGSREHAGSGSRWSIAAGRGTGAAAAGM